MKAKRLNALLEESRTMSGGPADWRKPMRFKRLIFFRVKSESEKVPEVIELKPKPPAMFDHLPLEDVISYFEKRIEEKKSAFEKSAKKRRKVLWA